MLWPRRDVTVLLPFGCVAGYESEHRKRLKHALERHGIKRQAIQFQLGRLPFESTFAVGGLDPALATGAVVLLRDQIALFGPTPPDRRVRVMVGGAPFVDRPDRVRDVGADSTAIDGEQATQIAEELLAAATGAIPGHLTGLPNALVHRGRVDSTMRWLLKPTPRALLQAIGAQESITHASVDACPPGQARHHLPVNGHRVVYTRWQRASGPLIGTTRPAGSPHGPLWDDHT